MTDQLQRVIDAAAIEREVDAEIARLKQLGCDEDMLRDRLTDIIERCVEQVVYDEALPSTFNLDDFIALVKADPYRPYVLRDRDVSDGERPVTGHRGNAWREKIEAAVYGALLLLIGVSLFARYWLG